MISLFVDTSAWYALADEGDINHLRAQSFFREAMARGERFITSNLIVGETYTLLCTRLGYEAAWEFLDRTRASTRLEIIFISPDLEEAAYALLKRYRNQPFSFVDGTSFVLMGKMGLDRAFAFDRHFEVAGFALVPDQA